MNDNLKYLRGLRHAIEGFYNTFPEGDDLVIEDIYGELHAGRLKRPRDDEYLSIQVGRKVVDLDWHEVVFVAHDGFPVQAIAKMKPDQAKKLADNFYTEAARNMILKMLRGENPGSLRIPPPPIRIGGGCPFIFEDVTVKALNNPGNNGPRFWGQDNEEELVLTAPDGATCLFYDLSHVFFMETETEMVGAAP